MASRRQRLVQRRKSLGLTQEDLAEHADVDRSTIGRWERGESEPQPWKRRRLARTLQVPLEQLDNLLTLTDLDDTGHAGGPDPRSNEWPDRRQPYHPDRGWVKTGPGAQPGATAVATTAAVGGSAPVEGYGPVLPDAGAADAGPGWVSQLGSGEVGTDRRTAAMLIADMLVGVSYPTGGVAGWWAGSTSGHRLTRGLLAAHVEVGEMLAGLYRGVDPRAALPMATTFADDLLSLYDAADSTVELAHLVVGVHAQVGLWACHADLPTHAHRYLATATEIASAQDPPLHARALGALSYLYSSAPRGGTGGRPHHALRLLDEAMAISARADPFTRGWLATWRADQHATLGDREAAQADIDLAAAALAARDDGQTIGFFSLRNYGYGMRGHHDSVQALVDGLAGRTSTADDAFASIQVHAANGRRRAASYAHQSLAYGKTTKPDPDAACAALLQSITLAAAEHYRMGITRASGVRHGFPATWGRLRCVREVDERLRQLPAAG